MWFTQRILYLLLQRGILHCCLLFSPSPQAAPSIIAGSASSTLLQIQSWLGLELRSRAFAVHTRSPVQPKQREDKPGLCSQRCRLRPLPSHLVLRQHLCCQTPSTCLWLPHSTLLLCLLLFSVAGAISRWCTGLLCSAYGAS